MLDVMSSTKSRTMPKDEESRIGGCEIRSSGCLKRLSGQRCGKVEMKRCYCLCDSLRQFVSGERGTTERSLRAEDLQNGKVAGSP